MQLCNRKQTPMICIRIDFAENSDLCPRKNRMARGNPKTQFRL
jgi:hypothetical protein